MVSLCYTARNSDRCWIEHIGQSDLDLGIKTLSEICTQISDSKQEINSMSSSSSSKEKRKISDEMSTIDKGKALEVLIISIAENIESIAISLERLADKYAPEDQIR